MLSYDPVTAIRHFPMAMGRFGTNPYNETLYRIVWAPSRRYLVYGEWPDGSVCARWQIKEKQAGDHWILEKWQSAEEYAGRPEWWDVTLGPWPERGEYGLMHIFFESLPTEGQVEKLITWSRWGREHVSFREIRNFERDQLAKEKKYKTETTDMIIRNRLPAFGCRPFAGAYVSRGEKTKRLLHFAEDLGLPRKAGPATGKLAEKLTLPQEAA
jgi:hypothetical protein